jgi:acetylornithine deacetylase
MTEVHTLVNKNLQQLYGDAVGLLKDLIAIPSFSKEENGSANRIAIFLEERGVQVKRIGNNVCATNQHFDPSKKTILINSHHDTVRPNEKYTNNPFEAKVADNRLYGLGSNDAGGSIVCMMAAFLFYHEKKNLKYNLLYVASAEEEISGHNGIESVLPHYKNIDFAIVGEPTRMEMAVAEKGLLVLDCISHGKAGHAAREDGENAIYKALQDIEAIRNYQFEKVGRFLGPVKMTVTSIESENKTHNVVPAECKFVIDIRVNELYTHEEVLEAVKKLIKSEIRPRGSRLRSSSIPIDHPIVLSGQKLHRPCYGSPTTSDKALMPFPGLKMGPGDSARSHTANEYIYLHEIEEAIVIYIELLKNVL